MLARFHQYAWFVEVLKPVTSIPTVLVAVVAVLEILELVELQTIFVIAVPPPSIKLVPTVTLVEETFVVDALIAAKLVDDTFVAISVSIVELGDLNSVEEATPVGPTVSTLTPVEEESVRRLAVWFVKPTMLRVVDPTTEPCRNAKEVEVVTGATANAGPLIRNAADEEATPLASISKVFTPEEEATAKRRAV